MRPKGSAAKLDIKRDLLRSFQRLLTLIGARISKQKLQKIKVVVEYMKLGRWMVDNQFIISARKSNRAAVFDVVSKRICAARMLYLEFGVYKGDSMKYWSDALKHKEAKLHGFDSFEGLSEDWDDVNFRKGHFDVGGKIPVINDPRVEFFKGWFDEVLPTYSLPDHDVLLITLDADLYSSTIYVLRHLRAYIKPGTFIYFDDMGRTEHEPRAFREFMKESGLRFKLVATDYSLNNGFFECVG